MTTVQLNTVTRRLEVFSSARDVQARAEIAAHAAAGDPHPQYLGQANAAAIATSGDAADLVTGTVPDGRMPSWAGYTVASKAALEAVSVPVIVDALRLLSYAAAGDGGGARYERVGTEPAHAGKIQSADGAWWEISEPVVNAKSIGATGDGVTDDTAALTALAALDQTVFIPDGTYAITAAIDPGKSAVQVSPLASFTGSGVPSGGFGKRGFFSDDANGASIWRFRDRVFVGWAADIPGSSITGQGVPWLNSDADGAGWMVRSAQVASVNTEGRAAVIGMTRTSDGTTNQDAVGVGGGGINDRSGASLWALYGDIQHEGGNWSGGLELAVKNKSIDINPHPYASFGGVYGVWLHGGGDGAYGGAATNPSAAGIVFLAGGHTWNKGIMFRNGALTAGSGGVAEAVTFYENCEINQYDSTGAKAAAIRFVATDSGQLMLQRFGNGQVGWRGPNDKELFRIQYITDAVNRIEVRGSATGFAAQVMAQGDDTDIDLHFVPKGTGALRFGTHSTIGAETLSGYIRIKDAGGTVRKLAVVS